MLRKVVVALALVSLTTASGNLPTVNSFVYCSCSGIDVPAVATIYEEGSCFPDVGKSKSYACSADGKSVITNYFNDTSCQGKASNSTTQGVSQCFKGQHDFDPVYTLACSSKPPFSDYLRDRYFTDSTCKELVYTDYHPMGCSKSCPQAYNKGVVNGTTYGYDFGCGTNCPKNDYCGNGDNGKMGVCVKDEYSALFRMVDHPTA